MRKRLASHGAALLRREWYGHPSDVIVPERFACLVEPLTRAAQRRFKTHTPMVWLQSKAPPERERERSERPSRERSRTNVAASALGALQEVIAPLASADPGSKTER